MACRWLVCWGLAVAGCSDPGAPPPGDGDLIADAGGPIDAGSDSGAPAAVSACDHDPGAETVTPAWGDPAPPCVATYIVASQNELDLRLEQATAGDCILVADGSYTSGTIAAAGTARMPIVLRAQNRGRAVMAAGSLRTTAETAYLVVEGFDWTSSGPLRIDGCDHCRLTRNRFHLTESGDMDWIVLTNTDHVRIDHNDIGPKAHAGNVLSIFGADGSVARHTRIDHNYIHDLHTGGDYPTMGCSFNPGGEAVRVGVSGLAELSSFTIVEHNLFERCDGDPETISSKTSDNVIRYNTFRSTAGYISLRFGDRGRACGNFVLGGGKVCSGGVRIVGADHQIFDNYVEGVAGYTMQLHQGDPTHPAVANAVVVYNTLLGSGFGLDIGGDASHCTIANNIVTGTSGQLIHLHGTRPPAGLVVAANLAPLGDATLGVSGAPWDAAFVDLDPNLVARGELSVLGPDSSNAIGHAATDYPFVTVDIDGEPRDSAPDIGADEYAPRGITHAPLDAAAVGPDAP